MGKMTDEEFRLECLKLAAPLYGKAAGYGKELELYNTNIPHYVTDIADQYLAYIKKGEKIPLSKGSN